MAAQSIANQLIGLQKGATVNGVVNWDSFKRQAVKLINNQGYTPEEVAQAANIVNGNNPNNFWDANRVEQEMAATPMPSYGLDPALQSIQQGKKEGADILKRTMGGVEGDFKQGLSYLQPFMDQGNKASSLQAMLSGAMGAPAQQQAFSEYQESPGVKWAREQGEKALLRNSAATGGLRGGNVLKALQEYGTGVALQDYGNQFNRMGEVAQRGYGASTTGAGMLANQGGIRANLGGQESSQAFNAGLQSAGMQFNAGQAMSQNIGGATTALANLQDAQGQGASSLYSNQANNIVQLQQAAANGDMQAKQQLAALLQNNNQSAAGQNASAPQAKPTDYLGTVSNLAGGLSGMLGSGTQQPSNSNFNYSPINNPQTGYGPNYQVPYNPAYNPNYQLRRNR